MSINSTAYYFRFYWTVLMLMLFFMESGCGPQEIIIAGNFPIHCACVLCSVLRILSENVFLLKRLSLRRHAPQVCPITLLT